MRSGSKLEIMPFISRSPISKSIFAITASEYEFSRAVSEQMNHELLKTDDAGLMHTVHWRNMQVAKQAAKIVVLSKAFINCFKLPDKPSNQIDIILAANSIGE